MLKVTPNKLKKRRSYQRTKIVARPKCMGSRTAANGHKYLRIEPLQIGKIRVEQQVALLGTRKCKVKGPVC